MITDQHRMTEGHDEAAVRHTAASNTGENASTPVAVPRLIVNADDWGRDPATTDRCLQCVLRGLVSSVSAMVFMEDSERAASLAIVHGVDAGLHLNLTTPFSGGRGSTRLREHQERVSRFLKATRFAPALYNPFLTASFRYVVEMQIDEFARIYGAPPTRVDGHHHMHLSANVQFGELLPAGAVVRRSFSFSRGEKSLVNRMYRRWQDRMLARRHSTTDYFFNLVPCQNGRLERILGLARDHCVEVEVHPGLAEQFAFLMSGELFAMCPDLEIARSYALGAAKTNESRLRYAIREKANVTLPVRSAECLNPDIHSTQSLPHICVCICTYKRPLPLRRLLTELNRQKTGSLFTYSIVVADNDESPHAAAIINAVQMSSAVPIKYCVEPKRGIARARNKVIENASGDFIALIDDDEFPSSDWLLKLFTACRSYKVDGVLGPVRRHFDDVPPVWLRKSSLYDRKSNPTGVKVSWREARTGNVLLKKHVFDGDAVPFRPEFRAGEDQDFFRRKIEQGYRFIWSGDADVFEVIPPTRWTRRYYVRKALLQGSTAALQPDCGTFSFLKSMVAVPIYLLALPFALMAGQHRFMTLAVKLCDHAGKLLSLFKVNPIREEYVSE